MNRVQDAIASAAFTEQRIVQRLIIATLEGNDVADPAEYGLRSSAATKGGQPQGTAAAAAGNSGSPGGMQSGGWYTPRAQPKMFDRARRIHALLADEGRGGGSGGGTGGRGGVSQSKRSQPAYHEVDHVFPYKAIT